ncbi:MAG: hypothetical protein PHR47_03975 [Candidatus Pacebacteria bacterium]|nr:hypothetical protein [Candidatus Paceibacterota bacterium]
MKNKILSALLFIALFFTISAPVFVGATSGTEALDRCIISAANAARLVNMEVECGYTTTDGNPVSGTPTEKAACPYSNQDGNCGACCLLSAVFNLTDWIFIGLMTISALMIIYGAYCFVMAGADPEKAKTGRSLLMYAAIGIAVAFFSRALPTLVKLVMGV